MSTPPRSPWSRSGRLVQLAAGMASRELKGRLGQLVSRAEAAVQEAKSLERQLAQARELVETLGQLKGAAMKAGQLLSMELRDVLPPEVIGVLSQLQAAGAAVDEGEVRSILREELGDRLNELEVAWAPLASASIGQVHRATWRAPGQPPKELVLKVQFRGIADAIDSDLSVLERIARTFLQVQGKRIDVGPIFAELADVLRRETDYLHEAEALERYRALAHRVEGLRVPEVSRALSSRRVLALSYEPGLTLDAWLKTSPPEALRQRFAAKILDLYFLEFFEWGLVQTDANFANFLFRPEAGELVLLDFGATRDYPAEFREQYRQLLVASIAGDRPTALRHAEALGLIDPQETPEARVALHELLESVLRVFQPQHQPVDFRDDAFTDAASARLKAYYRALTRSPAPAQLIFLHRKLGGVFSMGRALGARLDLVPWAQRLNR